MEAKLLAVTEVERTPTSKLTPKSANYGWQPLRDVLLIMLDTGMRPAEVFRMEWEHVRWDRELIFVPCGKSRKSKRYVPPKRYVPLSEHVKEALQMRAQERPSSSHRPAVVRTTSRRCRSNLTAPRNWQVYPRPLSSIVLGTDSVPMRMDATGNMIAVMDVMGHSKVDVTRLYQHPRLKRIGMAINKRDEVVQ